MAGKLSMGSNYSTFKNVSIDAGVKGMQGKATETRKTAISTAKKKRKKENKMYMAFACLKNRHFI